MFLVSLCSLILFHAGSSLKTIRRNIRLPKRIIGLAYTGKAALKQIIHTLQPL